MGGTQDNGTERWQGSPTWEHVADGDGGDCGVSRANPDTVFHTFYGMSPQRSTSRGDWNSWGNITPPVPSGRVEPVLPAVRDVARRRATRSRWRAARCTCRGTTARTGRASPSPGSALATAMYIPDPDTVLVGLDNGQVQRTTWSGSSWGALTALTTPRAGASVSDIAVDSNNASRIWVTYATVGGGRVFLSTDAGGAVRRPHRRAAEPVDHVDRAGPLEQQPCLGVGVAGGLPDHRRRGVVDPASRPACPTRTSATWCSTSMRGCCARGSATGVPGRSPWTAG